MSETTQAPNPIKVKESTRKPVNVMRVKHNIEANTTQALITQKQAESSTVMLSKLTLNILIKCHHSQNKASVLATYLATPNKLYRMAAEQAVFSMAKKISGKRFLFFESCLFRIN